MSHTPADLISALLTRATMPALVWYGKSERIELSGKVVAMHISKLVGYLLNDLAVSEDTRLVIDLPIHWKTLLWQLAGYASGCQVSSAGTDLSWEDIVVTNAPTDSPGQGVHLALNLDSLALSWNGSLPAGYDDATAAPMRFADTIDTSILSSTPLPAVVPPEHATRALAVLPRDIHTLCSEFIGAAVTNRNLVIITLEQDIETILAAENASMWDTI